MNGTGARAGRLSGTGRGAECDAGGATVVTAAVLGLLVAGCGAGLAVSSVLAARQTALAAADASALAGADVALGAAPGVPCDRAAAVAAVDGSTIVSCVQRGTVVRVGVQVAAPLGLALGDAVAGPPPGPLRAYWGSARRGGPAATAVYGAR